MSNYDYQNGEDAMSAIDSEFTSMSDAAFEIVDENMPEEQSIDWIKVCEKYFQMEVPDRDDKDDWRLHVMVRNGMMNAVNYRARALGRPWQLFIATQGVSVMKSVKTRMVEKIIEKRIKRVADSYKLIRSRLQPLAHNMELPRKDRKVIQEMVDLNRGAQLVMVGLIDRMPSLKKSEKQKLLTMFDNMEDTDEDDDSDN